MPTSDLMLARYARHPGPIGMTFATMSFAHGDSRIANRRSCNSLQTRLIGVFVSFPLTVERAS